MRDENETETLAMSSEDFVNPKEGRVTMCCGGKKCPVLSKGVNWINITDDFGNTICIPRSQEHAFVEAVSKLFL